MINEFNNLVFNINNDIDKFNNYIRKKHNTARNILYKKILKNAYDLQSLFNNVNKFLGTNYTVIDILNDSFYCQEFSKYFMLLFSNKYNGNQITIYYPKDYYRYDIRISYITNKQTKNYIDKWVLNYNKFIKYDYYIKNKNNIKKILEEINSYLENRHK